MHAATSSARALPACTFALQADTGAWDFEQRTFTPSNCEERLITPAAGRQCLRNRTLTFAGDSIVRDFAVALASYLRGVSNASAVEDGILGNGQTLKAQVMWEGRFPERRGLWAALRPRLKDVERSGAPGLHPGGPRDPSIPYSYTDRASNYTIRLADGLQAAKSWPSLQKLVMRGEGTDLVVMSLGLHDSALARDNSSRWVDTPPCWTHGQPFQRYLDLWCELRDLASADADGGTHRPPVVWMTINEQCARLKANPSYHYQVPLVHAANRHSRAATAELGLPLLDWSRMAPTDTTAACATTGDGVHVKQWVDLIRVRLFLSYLCTGEGGRFEPPVSTRDVARRLDRTKARCVVARSQGGSSLATPSDASELAAPVVPTISAEKMPASHRPIPRGARTPLGAREQRQIDNGHEQLVATVHALRQTGKRVPIWLNLSVHRPCVLEEP